MYIYYIVERQSRNKPYALRRIIGHNYGIIISVNNSSGNVDITSASYGSVAILCVIAQSVFSFNIHDPAKRRVYTNA